MLIMKIFLYYFLFLYLNFTIWRALGRIDWNQFNQRRNQKEYCVCWL